MKESKILESFIPERRCEEADKPESVTRLPEGEILVNPYGVEEYRGCFYYQDYQSYLDDEPYIRECIAKYVVMKKDTGGKHIIIEYDRNNKAHRMARNHSFLVLMQFVGNGVLLNGVVSTFKQAMTGKRLKYRHILPLKELELSTNLFDRSSKRAILNDVYSILKKRGYNAKR
jgi:hypothetical protein